jgi:hypothetical protein
MSVQEWDKLVQKTYNRRYDFQQQDGCKDRETIYFDVPVKSPDDFENETIPVEINGEIMGVKFTTWLQRDPKEKFFDDTLDEGLWWERNFYPHMDMVINDLYAKGLLSAGSYGIDIDW